MCPLFLQCLIIAVVLHNPLMAPWALLPPGLDSLGLPVYVDVDQVAVHVHYLGHVCVCVCIQVLLRSLHTCEPRKGADAGWGVLHCWRCWRRVRALRYGCSTKCQYCKTCLASSSLGVVVSSSEAGSSDSKSDSFLAFACSNLLSSTPVDTPLRLTHRF